MVNPVAASAVHAVVGTVVVSLVLLVWGERQKLLDVSLASVGAALVSLIPTVGQPLSVLAMLGLLYWRCSASVPALAASVALARLTMVPVLVALDLLE